jgi:hypothetical protein
MVIGSVTKCLLENIYRKNAAKKSGRNQPTNNYSSYVFYLANCIFSGKLSGLKKVAAPQLPARCPNKGVQRPPPLKPAADAAYLLF